MNALYNVKITYIYDDEVVVERVTSYSGCLAQICLCEALNSLQEQSVVDYDIKPLNRQGEMMLERINPIADNIDFSYENISYGDNLEDRIKDENYYKIISFVDATGLAMVYIMIKESFLSEDVNFDDFMTEMKKSIVPLGLSRFKS